MIADVDPLPHPGRRGQVVLRPEDIRIVSSCVGNGTHRTNMFRGKVVNSILLGPRVELQIAVANTVLRGWTESVVRNAFAPQSEVIIEIAPSSAAWISE
jgi:hypothetical protein